MAAKTMTQPKFFNSGQPDGYEPTTCPRCSGTGTGGGSKCTKCAGYGRLYVDQDPAPAEAPKPPEAPREELPPWRGDREYLQLQHERAWTPERYGGLKG